VIKMMELKSIPIIGRVAAQVESYVSERKKRAYVDLAHYQRCIQAGYEAEKEFNRVKDRALIETRSTYYR